jgi:hypothetical protein
MLLATMQQNESGSPRYKVPNGSSRSRCLIQTHTHHSRTEETERFPRSFPLLPGQSNHLAPGIANTLGSWAQIRGHEWFPGDCRARGSAVSYTNPMRRRGIRQLSLRWRVFEFAPGNRSEPIVAFRSAKGRFFFRGAKDDSPDPGFWVNVRSPGHGLSLDGLGPSGWIHQSAISKRTRRVGMGFRRALHNLGP